MTISSVVAMFGFADLGLGNGLLNSISESYGKDDREMARTYVSSAVVMLFAIAVLLGVLFALVCPRVPWPKVFNVVSPQAVAEAGPAMIAFVGCFLVNIPLGVVQRIQMGYQEGFVNSMWQALGSLLGLTGVLVVISRKAGLPWLVLAMAGAPVVAVLLNGVVLFGFRCPWLRPVWARATKAAAKTIFKLGIFFFILQVAIALAYSSDNVVAAQVLGPKAVSIYSVSMRMFNIAPMVLGMVLMPLWPAYGEAIARGDIAWVKQTLVRSLGLVVLTTGLPSIVLVVFGATLVRLWAGPAVVPPLTLLLGLGVWTVISAVGSAVSIFLNGANILRFQAVVAILMAISSLILKVFLSQAIGLPGIIWGTVIGYTVFSLMPTALLIPRFLLVLTARSADGGRVL
jgi:O-antigen/teichoic acid export membrane protein